MSAIIPCGEYPPEWKWLADATKESVRGICIRCDMYHDPPSGYCLTVHHFDGDKSNCEWWNLMALCQRCHLTIQAKVNPDQDYMFELSTWIKPYVAGRRAFLAGEDDSFSFVIVNLEECLLL